MPKIKLAVLISLFPHFCLAFSWDSPTTPFSTKENEHVTMLISWKPVDNIQKICEAEYKSRGFGLINYKVDACSFWNFTTRTCTIFTKLKPTMHDIGHEMRHCYQGNWH
jgi:hypothetical protein